jgi:hypothetical protein
MCHGMPHPLSFRRVVQNAADVEIYETYVPQKLKIGRPHPGELVSGLHRVPMPGAPG